MIGDAQNARCRGGLGFNDTRVLTASRAVVNGQVEVPAGGHEKSPPLGGFSGGGGRGAGSFRAGLFHAVGLALGGGDDGVVQEPIEEADRCGGLG